MTITSKHEWGSIVRGFETRCTFGGAREQSRLFNSQKATGQVFGVFEHTEYRTGRCGVVPGDLIMLFTDGLFKVEIAKGGGRIVRADARRDSAGVRGKGIQRRCLSARSGGRAHRCSRAPARGGMKAVAASSDNW